MLAINIGFVFLRAVMNFEHGITGQMSYRFMCMIYWWVCICHSARHINRF